MFGDESGCLPSNLSLFPSMSGKTVSKAAMVQHLVAIVDLYGVGDVGGGPGASLTGHSFRVTGAQFMAAVGVPLLVIQLLGRWQSDIVARYVAEAPLINLTKTYKTARCSLELEQVLSDLKLKVVSTQSQLAQLDLRTQELVRQEAEIEKVKSMSSGQDGNSECDMPLILNPASGKVHIRSGLDVDYGETHAPSKWSSPCGWPYGSTQFKRVPSLPSNPRLWCKSCTQGLFGEDTSSE